MQGMRSSNPPVVTGICDPLKIPCATPSMFDEEITKDFKRIYLIQTCIITTLLL